MRHVDRVALAAWVGVAIISALTYYAIGDALNHWVGGR